MPLHDLDGRIADLLLRKTAYELARDYLEAAERCVQLRRENDDMLFDHRRIAIANAAAAATPWKPPVPIDIEDIPPDESA